MEIGQHIEGKGVFTGTRELKDEQGASLGIFNLYAAPEDLNERNGRRVFLNFANAVHDVGKLRNWHGYDGAAFASDGDFHIALHNGSYKGEWMIPTFDILIENLYAHKDKGALAGTFKSAATGRFAARSFTTLDQGYWSITADKAYTWGMRVAVFAGTKPNGWAARGLDVMAVRPMRAEPAG